jgi:GT2 family glycosyltransferase
VARTRARGMPVWDIGAGANMAVRRRAFELVGPFDVRLGAGAAGCSEDTELWYRLLAEGWKCRYEPTAVVFHHHRSETTALEEQAFHYLRGHTAALWVQFARSRHWGNVRRAVLTLPPSLAGRLARHVLVSSALERRVARAELAGHLAGLTMVGLAAPVRPAARRCPPGPAAPHGTGTTPCDCS